MLHGRICCRHFDCPHHSATFSGVSYLISSDGLNYPRWITDKIAALLPSLQHLRILSLCDRDLLSQLNFLSQLPSLTEMNMAHVQTVLIETLSVPLPSIRKLDLLGLQLQTEELKAMLSHFPQLQELTLGVSCLMCNRSSSSSQFDPR